MNLSSPQSFNRYAYANNNPYRYVDPDGRLPVAIPFIIGAIGGGLTAYDTYDTYQTEGAGAAAKSAAVGAALTAAGAGAAKAAGSIGKRIAGFFRKDAAEGRKTSEGIGYTKHGLNQRINREVPTADVLDALSPTVS